MFLKYLSPKFILDLLASGFIGIGFISLIGYLLTGLPNYYTDKSLPAPVVSISKPNASNQYYQITASNCNLARVYEDGGNYDTGSNNTLMISLSNIPSGSKISLACMKKNTFLVAMSEQRKELSILDLLKN